VDRNALIAAAVLGIVSLVAVAVDQPWRMELRRAVVVERDERAGAAADARRKLARIQSNLERLAAGAPQWPTAEPDPLEAVVDLAAAYLNRDEPGFNHLAVTLEGLAGERLARQAGAVTPADYGERLRAAAAGESGQRGRLARLVALLRTIDAALVLEAAEAERFGGGPFDLVARAATRPFLADDRRFDGTRLRLPCRMVVGRRQDFEAATARFGDLAGPLLSCPAETDKAGDIGLMERIARDPKGTAGEIVASARSRPAARRRTGAPATGPWDHDAAIAFMADDPDAAEPVLRQAATDAVGRLDLALFLHAFRAPSPQRDDEIRRLIAAVDAEATAKAQPMALQAAGPHRAYDGSDASLLPSLRLAGFTEVAVVVGGDYRYPYGIPCAIWLKRPELAKVRVFTLPPELANEPPTLPEAPVSGCLTGRGAVPGFPEAAVAEFVDATADADGGGWTNHAKLPRYPLTYTHGQRLGQALLFEPRRLLDLPEPVAASPYLNWSYLSLGNRAIWEKLQPPFETARIELAAFLRLKGLTDAEAAIAATKALFAMAYGANCGGEPLPSLRQLLIEGMAPEGLVAFASSRDHVENPLPAYNCAAFSPPDPIAHVAVVNPKALAALWPLQRPGGLDLNPNGRNGFGKTPLMAAAQADMIDSARFLLGKGARINADTWQSGAERTLAHDGRTALMYAAATGSLEMIEALLKAGGDTLQADTQGRRAIDYLLGYGPTPPNTRLTPTQRAEAAALLF